MTTYKKNELTAGTRVKGYGLGVPTATWPGNFGTVLDTDGWNAKVEWDTGEISWQQYCELKRL